MPTPIRGCASTAEQRIALIDPKTATFGVWSRTSHVLSPNKEEYSALKIIFLGWSTYSPPTSPPAHDQAIE
jgi:hypothetical protein